jgi:hypothetical protein
LPCIYGCFSHDCFCVIGCYRHHRSQQARRYLAEKKVLVREVRAQRNQEQSISAALQSVLSFNTHGCNSPLTAAIDPAGPIPIARRAVAEDFRIGNW